MSGQGGVLDSRQSFKGTLLQLQDKVKRDPGGYRDDVMMQLRHFESKIALFQLTPTAASKDMCELIAFLSHVAPLFKEEARVFPKELLAILDKHKDVLDRGVRKAMVQALCLLRSRHYVDPKEVLPLWFRLFKVKDKDLRKLLLTHIVSDIKKMNAKTKNPQVNKHLQNYMYSVIAEDDPIAGRHALWVIIDLYRRKIWTEDKVVNVVSTACFSKHTKVMSMALRFLMGHFPKDMEEDEDSDDEEPQKSLKKGRNYAKKTKARSTAKEKVKSKMEKAARKQEQYVETVFQPIEVLNDPQGFGEKLLSQLQRTKERFNVRMQHMGVLSSIINIHKILLLNFYPYVQRYMEPHQQHVTHIMAWASQSVHSLVPPESLHSLMMTIANHFVSDKSTSDAITVGINTLREICRRQPLVMTEDLLQDIAQYKRFKKDKGVVMASRSMIQLFRELQPDLLARKDRGRDADTNKKITAFGTKVADGNIDGLDLLEDYYKEKAEKEGSNANGEDDWSAEETDEDSESGSWISVSEDDSHDDIKGADKDDNEDDESGEWVSCDEEDEEMEESEPDADEDNQKDTFEAVKDIEPGVPLTREQIAKRETDSQVAVGAGRLMETKFLTPRDFQLIERLKQKRLDEGVTGNEKKRLKRKKHDDGDIHNEVSTDLLEEYSVKKRIRDAEERKAHTEAYRETYKAANKISKKAGGTTNQQKKKGKLAQMVMRSRAVQGRKYETGKDKRKRAKHAAKKNTKFRYKKGGH